MICPQCQHSLSSTDARFCPNCGKPLDTEGQASTDRIKHNVFYDVANRINQVAGMETPQELRLGEVFSQVFAKHTEEDAERLFFVGTSQTTPNIENMADTWPKPWLFARVFLVVALSYFGLYLGCSYFNNINFLPGLITVGAFMVPFSLLIFFWELNVPQNIAIYKIVKVAFAGGILSLVTAMVFYQSVGNLSGSILTAVIEEAAKVLALVWFLKGKKYPYILNGLLIGAAVGTGFAAFESAGYAFTGALTGSLQSMYTTLFWRGVLAPGGHIVWAALSGAALCMVKGNREFRFAMLKDIRFLRIFAIVVVLHAAWDSNLTDLFSFPVVQIALTVVSWVIAFAVIGTGLKQISQLKQRNNAVRWDSEAQVAPTAEQ